MRAIRSLELPESVSRSSVIVVDNDSTDRTAEIARTSGAKVVSCRPGTPAHARNTGAAQATTDWLAFVDADCELAQDWLANVAPALDDEDVVAVGSRILPPSAETNWIVAAWGGLVSGSPSSKAMEAKRWLPTAGLVVRREAFQAMNGFDESLETCEDCDFGLRLSPHGKILLCNAAVLTHHGESKSLREIFLREAWRTKGNFTLAKKRIGDWKNWVSLLLPPLLLATFFVTAIWAVLSFFRGASPILPCVFFLAATISPLLLVLRKRSASSALGNLGHQYIVMVTYLAGRACGLFVRFQRVAR